MRYYIVRLLNRFWWSYHKRIWYGLKSNSWCL